MGKMSSADKMRILTLCKQGCGAKAIVAAYPLNNWKLSRVKKICQRVDQSGSATECKADSGRPKSTRLGTNIARVKELSGHSVVPGSGQNLSTREIAAELDISCWDLRP